METENTNPAGEVSDDELVERLLASQDEEGEQDEPQEERAEAEDEQEEQDEPKKRRLRVKIDGAEHDVDEDEVVAGYQRQQDYTRKTQEVATQRQAIEAERQAIAQVRAQHMQALQVLQQQLQGEQPNWEALKDDTFAFNAALAKEMERQTKLQQAQAEHARLFQQQQHEDAQRHAEHLKHESEKLATLIPEYGNAEKRKAIQSAIRNHALSIGFSDEELAGATDARAVKALYDSMRYQELMQRVQKVKPTVVQTAKPGAIRPPANKATKSLERLKRTGSDADAIEYLLNR